MMTGLEATEPALTLPKVRLVNGSPIAVLGACKRVALKADWPLRRWVEFRESAQACLGAECSEDEHRKFLSVVRSYFTVELAPGFTADPLFTPHPEDLTDE